MHLLRTALLISEFMKGRLVANGIPAEKIVVESPKIESLRVGIGSDRVADSTPALNDSTPTLNDSTPTLNDPNPTLNDPNHAFVDLLYVGQLIRGKGVQLLLAAMARACSSSSRRWRA